jgi:hypothetical protein
MLKKRVIVGLGAVAALVLSPGCGGSGSYTPSFNTGQINFQGAVGATETVSTSVTVPASGGFTTITSNGTTVVIPSGAVPAGTVLPAGTKYQVYPAGIGFPGTLPSGSQLEVNNNDNSGIAISTTGFTETAFALPSLGGGTSYELGFLAGTYSTGRAITVGKLKVLGVLKGSDKSGGQLQDFIPGAISGNLPNNGQNAGGSTCTAIFADAFGVFDGVQSQLVIVYDSTFTLRQTQTVSAAGVHTISGVKGPVDTVTFTDFINDTQSVPAGGVTEVDLNVLD